MNLLESVFLSLTVFMLVSGVLVNYGNALLPSFIVQAFRYGRANISNSKPRFIRNIEVPKRWFYHFYMYAVGLQLAVLMVIIRMYRSDTPPSPSPWLQGILRMTGERTQTVSATATLISNALFWIHLSRRLYETLYVSVYSNTKMNLVHYSLAFIHYTGAILCLVAHSPLLASSTAVQDAHPTFEISEVGPVEVIGIISFLVGNYLQHQAHVGLASLRKGKDKKEASGHKIPEGGLFEYISCPNYFAEILIYSALAGLLRFSNSSWNYCSLWVLSNQITSGIMNHLWYHATFKDYPKQRKAIFPFIL